MKKFFTILLAIVMVFCLMPTDIAFADATVLTKDGGELSGSYYLNADLTMESEISVLAGNTLSIDLNGHTLTLHNVNVDLQYYGIDNMGTLNIINSGAKEDGIITGGKIRSGGNGTLTVDNVTFKDIDNTNQTAYGGGAICAFAGTFNITNSDFNNIKAYNGGAIYCTNKIEGTIDNCTFTNCEATIKGGAIIVVHRTVESTYANITITNTNVTNNTAGDNGGGIAMSTSNSCFSGNTLITMADGSVKKASSIKEGDLLKTFDHETGSISTEKVHLVYEGKKDVEFCTLNFTNNEVTIAGTHAFFENESNKYVIISTCNANEYIGKHFYNANTGAWEELVSITSSPSEDTYYSIYTAHHINCIANNMLTVPDDNAWILNVFEMDENLKIDQAKKKADIKKYGLFKYSKAKYMPYEEYDAYNMQYLYVAIGKGVAPFSSMEEAVGTSNEMYGGGSKNIFEKLLDFFTIDKAYADTSNKSVLKIGANVIIDNNMVGTVENNLYIDTNSEYQVLTGSKVMVTADYESEDYCLYTVTKSTYPETWEPYYETLALKIAAQAEIEAKKLMEDIKIEPVEEVKPIELVASTERMIAPDGKDSVKVTWVEKYGRDLSFEGYDIYRATTVGGTFRFMFNTTNEWYYNTLIRRGNHYWYKVRGYNTVSDEKVYSSFSNVVDREVK